MHFRSVIAILETSYSLYFFSSATKSDMVSKHDTPTEPRGVQKINGVKRKRSWCLLTITYTIR